MNQRMDQYSFAEHQILEIVQGDITREDTDAVVNAANAQLMHGGGVAGAIVRAGGPEIQAESSAWVRSYGPVQHARPAVTGAGRLPCRYIIHAVGPVWGEGDEDRKLSSAIRGSLELAERLHLKSIAFPAISTGIFGFPKERAAKIFFDTCADTLKTNPASGLETIRLTLFDQPTLNSFLNVFQQWKTEQQHSEEK